MTANDLAKLAQLATSFREFQMMIDNELAKEAEEQEDGDRFLAYELHGPIGTRLGGQYAEAKSRS